MYLQKLHVNVAAVADELYDLAKPGVVALPGLLLPSARRDLVHAFAKARRYFKKPPKRHSSVYMGMRGLYADSADQFVPEVRTGMRRLAGEYAALLEKIGREADFEPGFNSIGVHYYRKTTGGMDVHRDYPFNRNVIAIFVVSGNTPFYVCRNKKKEDPLLLPGAPGTLILLRAARHQREQFFRPFHYLGGPIAQDRYSVIFRLRRQRW